ncbi:MAG: hypothetical protein KDD60_03245 [Bdellovibrionales bacterium]|nr:hypothetical protein [Bdellovibrionales bacterium]
MSSLLKVKKKERKGNALVGFIVVGVLIAACFYLPSLLNFNWGSSTVASNAKPDASPSPKHIDELLEPITEGSHSRLAELEVPADEETLAEDTVKCSAVEVEEKKEEELLIPTEGAITWEHMQRPEIQTLLENTYKGSNELLAMIEPHYVHSRFDLMTFISSVARLRSGEGDPEQLLLYADYSDSQATQSFANELLPRPLRLKWKELSLAPIFRKPLSVRVRENHPPVYNPKLSLMDVTVVHDYVQDDRLYPWAPARATIRGYVVGDDTDKVEWQIGERSWEARDAWLRPADRSGRRYFEILDIPEIRGKVVTVKAISKDGTVFQKRYNFFPRVKHFKAVKKDGVFQYRIPFQPFDPRMDQAFLVQQAVYTPEELQFGKSAGSTSALVRF